MHLVKYSRPQMDGYIYKYTELICTFYNSLMLPTPERLVSFCLGCPL